MLALSIRPPWGNVIVTGHKDIENRTWSTRFRGRFYVHVGKTFDYAGYHWMTEALGLQLPAPSAFVRGGIIGSVELVDVVTEHPSPWFVGPYGFVLRDPRPLAFVPLTGRLGFFDVDLDAVRAAQQPSETGQLSLDGMM
jgi:hypothetical protein